MALWFGWWLIPSLSNVITNWMSSISMCLSTIWAITSTFHSLLGSSCKCVAFKSVTSPWSIRRALHASQSSWRRSLPWFSKLPDRKKISHRNDMYQIHVTYHLIDIEQKSDNFHLVVSIQQLLGQKTYSHRQDVL